jgi:histidine phosphotransferase ChpT
MNDTLRLAELLCARLCHDLAGPLGALIGVLEIAREEDPNSDTLALAELTTVELGQRLKLLRAAWGQDAEGLDLDTLQGLTTGLVAGSRPVRLDLTGLAPGTRFPPPQARLVLNVVMLAAESLPGGGLIALAGSPDSSFLLVTISGARAAWPTGFTASLFDDTAALQTALDNPRHVQGPLTVLLARGLGCQFSMMMPAGAGDAGNLAPPLLLSFGQR